MTNKDKHFLAYVAGIIDGEGCIYIDKRSSKKFMAGKSPQYRLTIKVEITESVVPLLLWEKFGGFVIYQIREERPHRPYYFRWEIDGTKAYNFLKLIKPYLILKYEQCLVAMSFDVYRKKINAQRKQILIRDKLGRIRYAPARQTPQVLERFDKYYWLLRKIKKDITKGVNSVDILKRQTLRQYRAKQEDYKKTLEGVETKHRELVNRLFQKSIQIPIEAINAPEKDIVQNKNLGSDSVGIVGIDANFS